MDEMVTYPCFVTVLDHIALCDNSHRPVAARIHATSHLEDLLVGKVVARIHDSPTLNQYRRKSTVLTDLTE